MAMQLVAFLRAINVGGHTVKMENLRILFESFGLKRIQTFIASGNVLFSTSDPDLPALTARIETGLESALGYRVSAFLRTPAELTSIAHHQAFDQSAMQVAEAYNIGFLEDEPAETAREKLLALQTDIDRLHLHGRELYWLCRVRQSQSSLSNAAFEKALGMHSTLRGISTIQKIDTLLSSQPG